MASTASMARLGVLLLLVGGVAQGADNACGHGALDPDTKTCVCDAGWRASGPTDPAGFLAQSCRQYMCSTADACRQGLADTPFSDASCPVQGWNCYCGMTAAFRGGLGGYQGRSAACMGPLYASVFGLTRFCEAVLLDGWGWRVFALAALALLPFGQERTRCPHLPNTFAGFFGRGCDGRCMARSVWSLADNLAWSGYALRLGIWAHALVVALWLTAALIWATTLVFVAVLVIVMGFVSLACAALCSCDGGGGADCGEWNCGSCGSCDGNCGSCDCCVWEGAPAQQEFFTTWMFTPGSSGCEVPSRGLCCWPLALALWTLPDHPCNAWGGAFGYWALRTHRGVPEGSRYAGGDAFVDFLGFPASRDLRGDRDWRGRVARFVASVGDAAPLASRAGDLTPRGVALVRAKGFQEEELLPSSWSDYNGRDCWICMNAEAAPSFDLWLPCKHLYCTVCSQVMLSRGMPCPQCRAMPTAVRRAFEGP